MAAPYRLGLTATIEREDNLHKDFPKLVGGVVFQANPSELAKNKHLAPYEIERRQVKMTSQEKQEYDRNYGTYQVYLIKSGIRMNHTGAFQRLIMMSAKSKVCQTSAFSPK